MRRCLMLALMAGLSTAALIGCGKKEEPKPATPPAASATPSTPAAASGEGAIGVAECDEYITKYKSCIESKVPEAMRGVLKEPFDKTIAAWKQSAQTPEGKAGLAVACKAALEGAKAALAVHGCSL